MRALVSLWTSNLPPQFSGVQTVGLPEQGDLFGAVQVQEISSTLFRPVPIRAIAGREGTNVDVNTLPIPSTESAGKVGITVWAG